MIDKITAGILASSRRKGEPTDHAVEQARKATPSWEYFLRGLWLSGLRLSESLDLYWDDDGKIVPDLGARRPVFRIPAELQKSNEDATCPIAPEFVEFLLAVPEDQRTGPVFNPAGYRGRRPTKDRASKVICAIGEAAGVKVRTDPNCGKIKYASAPRLAEEFRHPMGIAGNDASLTANDEAR